MTNFKVTRFMIHTVTALSALAVMVSGCGSKPTGLSPTGSPAGLVNSPTLIFYNGNVLTMDKDQPQANAIALADDKILAVGSDVDILALKLPATQVIDLQGRTMMPGFIDTHSHLLTEGVNNPAIGSIQKAQELALQAGITTLGNLYTSPGFLAEMQALDDSGGLLVRTSLYMPYANACGQVEGNWYQQYPPTHQPGEMLRIAGVKLYTDGGSCGYPATSFNRQTGGEGDLWFTQEELNTIVSDIDAAGYQVAIHAIGDRAVEQALNAIEFTLHGRPNTLRHRIEHNTTVNPDSYARYQEIGVVPTIIGNVWSCNEVFFTQSDSSRSGGISGLEFPLSGNVRCKPGCTFRLAHRLSMGIH